MSKLDPAVIEEIKERRLAGESVESIAEALNVATGSVSRYGGKVKRVGTHEGRHEERPKLFPSADKLPFDAEALELANRLRRERIQEELDSIEAKKLARSRNVEIASELDALRIREREIFLKLNQGTGASDETVQLRAQVLALAEQRHNLELSMLEARLSGQIAMLQAQQGSISKYGLMSEAMGKLEGFGVMVSQKLDKLSIGSDFSQALALGLSPQEYSLLKQGPPLPPMSKAKWTEGFRAFSNVYAKKLEGQETKKVDQSVLDLQYRSYMSDQQLQVENYEKIMTRISGRGENLVTAPVLTGKTNVVSLKCSNCNEVIAIDLLDAKLRQSRVGKCPNCRATVDLRSYFPADPPQPEEDLPSGWGNNPGDEPR